MKTQAERQWEAQILAGRLSGVTGSDQTGASINGYREDISYKSPNNEWTNGERGLYEYYLKSNPKDAEVYAIRVRLDKLEYGAWCGGMDRSARVEFGCRD